MDQLTRNQKTIRSIAQLLLALKPGDRLPPIQAINRQIEVGVGTVQKALSVLTGSKAVAINARGHMGSFVESVDYALLWGFAGHGPIKLLLPHLDAVEFKGLSEGIDSTFEQHGIRARIDHRQGATSRMNSVREGNHDACVVSNLAFQRGPESGELDAVALKKSIITELDPSWCWLARSLRERRFELAMTRLPWITIF
ncbi:helix-turn-helix domain-containing protein [Mesorhizobium sp. ORM8.1]